MPMLDLESGSKWEELDAVWVTGMEARSGRMSLPSEPMWGRTYTLYIGD